MIVRELVADDLEAVVSIEATVSPDPWSLALFAGELQMHSSKRHWLVALEPAGASDSCSDAGSALVGFGGVMYVADDAHVMNIAVDPRKQGAGLGRRLLAHLVLEAIDRGARNLTLEVRVSNSVAIAMYRHFKLAPVGSRPRYYPDGEDALILWAHDIDRPEYRELVAQSLGTSGDGRIHD